MFCMYKAKLPEKVASVDFTVMSNLDPVPGPNGDTLAWIKTHKAPPLTIPAQIPSLVAEMDSTGCNPICSHSDMNFVNDSTLVLAAIEMGDVAGKFPHCCPN